MAEIDQLNSAPKSPHTSFDWRAADAYLFDIDGTLLNTRDPTHYLAFRNAVRDVFGFDATIDGVPVHGNTDIGILRAVVRRAGFSDAEFDLKIPQIVAQMCAEVRSKAAEIRADVCPSIRELLQTLHVAGKLLAVVSGNLEPIGWAKLEATGLREFFSFGAFSDHHELREEIFQYALAEVRRRIGPQATSCVVGDTPSDIRAARAAGAQVIAVATGIYGVSDLLALQPDLCVPCCTNLLQPAS